MVWYGRKEKALAEVNLLTERSRLAAAEEDKLRLSAEIQSLKETLQVLYFTILYCTVIQFCFPRFFSSPLF